ncbi:glycosyltransferase family 4 protein [Paenarthrobacter aurescens]|uniref:glycosyltransferase family 4 protein n=1 Tax=Paenarthrobacter aurescens TaxID=43663 RepID=UPI0021C22E33|nr:glycosyltransferase family 4 protein [Paenarthrobacter aurescens]MCT9869119.1 glycosyltransferase family 4 protein [Paenarthrobacter aurescens]
MTYALPDLNSPNHLAGKHVLVLNWRDVKHSNAGGAEQYMHEISKRWVQSGVQVTWFTGRDAGQPAEDVIDGVRILRAGGALSIYGHSALRLLRTSGQFDAVVDCQNGIPFFSPLFLPRDIPIVQLVHHVHQEQFRTRFSPPLAAIGRFLESSGAKTVYGQRSLVAVSPSTRLELRRLGFSGPIHVVPNGTSAIPPVVNPRAVQPTIAVVSRLVPHKRLDLLLGQFAVAARTVPRLRMDIVGDGPEGVRLQQLAMDLGLDHAVTFHGYQPNEVRDELLSRAWLTASTSASEGWGCSVIEAAAWGVPCLALRVPGIRDSVVDGRTGWLVDTPAELGTAMVEALTAMSEPDAARNVSVECREWAGHFSWDRSTRLLTGVLMEEERIRREGGDPRSRHSDLSTLVRFELPEGADLPSILRRTDEVAGTDDGYVSVLMKGRDEFEAFAAMQKIGVPAAELRSAGRTVLLAGPGSAFAPADALDGP